MKCNEMYTFQSKSFRLRVFVLISSRKSYTSLESYVVSTMSILNLLNTAPNTMNSSMREILERSESQRLDLLVFRMRRGERKKERVGTYSFPGHILLPFENGTNDLSITVVELYQRCGLNSSGAGNTSGFIWQ